MTNACTDNSRTPAALAAIAVADLLPHRPPFIMIDRLIYCDKTVARTVLTVRDDNLFCAGGLMEEAGLIENIAQTCAAHTGYTEMFDPESKGAVRIGVVGLIKTMQTVRPVRTGETLTTTVSVREKVFNATLIEATVRTETDEIATCEMKLFLTDKIPKTEDGKGNIENFQRV